MPGRMRVLQTARHRHSRQTVVLTLQAALSPVREALRGGEVGNDLMHHIWRA